MAMAFYKKLEPTLKHDQVLNDEQLFNDFRERFSSDVLYDAEAQIMSQRNSDDR